ncbi:MAG: insulinase family protein, partial [Planctomycetes bacterium]|nr:insulinase family protein [Planctomycetota bacterium]
ARALVESSFWKDLGDIRKHLDWLALHEMRAGGVRRTAGHLARLLSVGARELREAAEEVLRPGNLSVCCVRPEGDALPGRTAATLAATARDAERRAARSPAPSGPAAPKARAGKVPLSVTRRPSTPRVRPLDGGGRLVVRTSPGVPLFAAQVLFRGGRAAEEPGRAGLTALAVGAMMRGARGLPGAEIALRSERLGVEISPVVGADAFGFAVEGRASAFEPALELLAEIASAPAFEASEVEREREALLGRIRAGRDNPRSWVMENFEEAVFAGHPYGNPARGSEDAVRAFSAADLGRWHAASVNRANLVLAVGGDLTESRAGAAARRCFGPLPAGAPFEPPRCSPPSSEVVRTDSRPLKQTSTAVGFAAVPLTHPDFEAFDVLAWMSRGDGGRFYDEIRAKRGLAYVVHALNIGRSAAGAFLGFTGTSPEAAEEAERILMAEYARFAKEPPPEEELERTKSMALGMHALGLRTESAFVRALGEAVSRDDIARVAAAHFVPARRVKIQMAGKTGG